MRDSNKYPQTSLIISTYNRPNALSLCLKSIARQTVLPNEVVIGDDGSNEETKNLIQFFQKYFSIPIVHVWQEDKGFRLAMCRNKAVAACRYEYIIEIDGDLILEKHFVEDHLVSASPGYFLKGGRVNLTESCTIRLCRTQRLPKITFFSYGIKRRVNSFRLLVVSRYLSARYKKNQINGLGCNMSYWKKDYIAINGYDEFFEGWGGEDGDFANRMLNHGVKCLYLKFSGIVYHLWHKDLYMYNKKKNFDYCSQKVIDNSVRCNKGINQYLIDID